MFFDFPEQRKMANLNATKQHEREIGVNVSCGDLDGEWASARLFVMDSPGISENKRVRYTNSSKGVSYFFFTHNSVASLNFSNL